MPRSGPPSDRTQMLLFEASAPGTAAGPAAPPRARGRFVTPAGYRHPRAGRELLLEGTLVAYEFRRARRRSIGFVVGPEGLSVSAPRWVGVGEVDAALRSKSSWILRKLAEQHERGRQQAAAQVSWCDGAVLPVLGRPLRLRRVDGPSGVLMRASASADGGDDELWVGIPADAPARAWRELVLAWLHQRARELFAERSAHYAARLGVQVRRVALSNASTRWGSASADGSIRLNWRLIHLGLPTIDYVVAHELAHLRHMDHSPRFWDVVRSVVPDMDDHRAILRQQVLPVLD